MSQASTVVASWPGGPGPNVALRGPEPLSHPEIPAIVDGIMALGVQRLCLATSGVPLADRATAYGVVSAGVTHIRFCILGATAEAHDFLAGAPGSFDAAMEGVNLVGEACRSRGTPHMLCAEIPVCDHTVEQLPGIVATLAARGVRSIALDLSHGPETPYRTQWVEAAIDTGVVSGAWVCAGRSPGSGDVGGRGVISVLDMEIA